MKRLVLYLLVALVGQAAQAQQPLPTFAWPTASSARWAISFSSAYTHNASSAQGYLNSQLDATYTMSGFALGARLHLNRKQHFSFKPEPFVIEVREGITVISTDDTTPSESYWIDQPVTLSWTKSFPRWTLSTSWSVLLQGASRAEPRLDEVEEDVFFVGFDNLAYRKTNLVGNVIAQYHLGHLYLQAGVLSIPGLQQGDRDFKREYTPTPQPYAGLGWQAAAMQFGGFVDTKRVSATYQQTFSDLRLRNALPVESALTYQRGLDEFAFDRLRLSLTVPLSPYFQGFVVLDKVWSAHRTIREQDFERWQNAGVFGDGQALYSMLPHEAAWAGLRLTIPHRQPWPLELVRAELYQNHLFPAKHILYAQNPVGTVEVRNTTTKPHEVQFLIRNRGTELYRSQTVTLPAHATRTIPLFLYQLPALDGTPDAPVQLDIAAVTKEREEALTHLSATLYGKNAWPGRTWELKYFLTPEADAIRQRAEQLYLRTRPPTSADPRSRFEHLQAFLTALGEDVTYLPDATTTTRVDHVQYPAETLDTGGGDCEDLTVLLASSLMAVGIHTAVVDLRPQHEGTVRTLTSSPGAYGHVFLLVDTGIEATALDILGLTEFQGLTRPSSTGTATLWIPLEPTVLEAGFDRAFAVGVQQYYDVVIAKNGAAHDAVQVYDF